jgi:hypothetical protein
VAATEQPFGYDPVFDAAESRRGPSGGHRDYSALPKDHLAGTADAVALPDDEDRVVVTDFKTGSFQVPDPHENLQLLLLALAASRFYGRKSAVAQVVRVDESGGLHARRAELSPEDLGAARLRILTLLERVEASRAGEPELRPGRQCRFCPAMHRCPAIAGEAQALVEDPLEELDEGTAAVAWRRVLAAEAAAKRAREALASYVAGRGDAIPLGDGQSLRLVESRRKSLDSGITLALIRERLGDEAAAEAASFSPTSVKKALPAADAKEVLAEIESRGGVTVTTYESLREGKAKGQGG